MTIYLNAAKCKTCGTVLVSISRHDYVECPCGNAIDGGYDYQRRTAATEAEPFDPDFEKIVAQINDAVFCRRKEDKN